MRDETKTWLRTVGPRVLLMLVFVGVNAVFVLNLHREGSRNDVAPLVLPAHYILQKPESGRFDDACLSKGWAQLSPFFARAPEGALRPWPVPSFVAGGDRERELGSLDVPGLGSPARLRVSIREPTPFPTVVQIEFQGALPDGAEHPTVVAAKHVLLALDAACGVPYVAPAECGAIVSPACRAFRKP